jgi:glycosyltransferase involved in cell wall biosynthesis
MKLLNLGCGESPHPDWVNVDFQSTSPGVVTHDLAQNIPYLDDTFDVVHLGRGLGGFPESGLPSLLAECRRVLRPGGVLRLAAPWAMAMTRAPQADGNRLVPQLLKEAGFEDVGRVAPHEGRRPDILARSGQSGPEDQGGALPAAAILEARKPQHPVPPVFPESRGGPRPKTAILSVSDYGGAGTSTHRLHLGLRQIGCPSVLCVAMKHPDHADVRLVPPGPQGKVVVPDTGFPGAIISDYHQGPVSWQLQLEQYPDRHPGHAMFSSPIGGIDIESLPVWDQAQAVNLHWVAGMVDWRRHLDLLAGRKVVWTLHDMNPFTGGCHYAYGCRRYIHGCGACPQLGSKDPMDFTARGFRIKEKAYEALDITVVAPSRWLGNLAKESRLLGSRRVEVIPYGLPTDVFSPRPGLRKSNPRVETDQGPMVLGEETFVLLFGAAGMHDPRKGFDLFLEALRRLQGRGRMHNTVLLAFGKMTELPAMPVPTSCFGYVAQEDELCRLYNLADAFVLPTRGDNLPNVALEALSCGTPVVSYNVGGLPDIVDHGTTGWLAAPQDPESLAQGVLWAREARAGGDSLRRLCREKALASWPLTAQAEKYVDLINELLATKGRAEA